MSCDVHTSSTFVYYLSSLSLHLLIYSHFTKLLFLSICTFLFVQWIAGHTLLGYLILSVYYSVKEIVIKLIATINNILRSLVIVWCMCIRWTEIYQWVYAFMVQCGWCLPLPLSRRWPFQNTLVQVASIKPLQKTSICLGSVDFNSHNK